MHLEFDSNTADDRRSGERVHPEPPDPLRTAFELDRHRVLSSAAFRRLEHKTQVFAPSLSDHFRTRLTHTLEVAHLARCLARALRVNEDLAEAIALAHDLGHPPFGHAGEVALDEAMRDHGGFNHNAHSLRVVQFLEHPFPSFRGLNLTRATLVGLASHVTRYDTPTTTSAMDADNQSRDRKEAVPPHVASAPDVESADGARSADVGSAVRTFSLLPPPLLRGDQGGYSADAIAPPVDPLVRESLLAPSVEAEIASLADRLAYNLHDLEDAIGAELITLDDLAALEPWRATYDRIAKDYSDRSIFALRRSVLDAILDGLLADAIMTSRTALASTTKPGDVGVAPASSRCDSTADVHPTPPVRTDANAVRMSGESVSKLSVRVSLSPSGETILRSLEEFLLTRVYRHPEIARTDAEGREVVRTLFDRFLADPSLLPRRFSSRIPNQGPHRVVCDYLAGMTDRFCKTEHARLDAVR